MASRSFSNGSMNPTNRQVIEGGYLADILDQPRALRETASALDTPPALDRLAGRLAAGEFHRVVLTGMGSSFHALHPLHIEFVAHGLPSIAVETSELLFHLSPLLRERTLLVVVSQSGASIEIVRLLRILPPGTPIIAVTNTAESPLANEATAALCTRAGTESTVSCKTYLAALLMLSWLSGILRRETLEPLTSVLQQAGPAVAKYLQDWRAQVKSLQAELDGVRSLFLVGRGPSLAAAGVGGLIIKESAHLHAEGMSSAAFRHGPFEMLSRETFVGVFLGDARTAALNQRLCADVVRAGGRAAAIGQAAADGPFRLPAAPEGLRPILEMLPVEMISLALAANAGREAGRFERASKITTTE